MPSDYPAEWFLANAFALLLFAGDVLATGPEGRRARRFSALALVSLIYLAAKLLR